MPADPRIDPVADIERPVGTDGDVGRPEERRDRVGDAGGAHHKIGPGVLLLHVRGQEHLPIESETRPLADRLVGEHLVAPRVRREERPVPGRAEAAVLVEDIAGR